MIHLNVRLDELLDTLHNQWLSLITNSLGFSANWSWDRSSFPNGCPGDASNTTVQDMQKSLTDSAVQAASGAGLSEDAGLDVFPLVIYIAEFQDINTYTSCLYL